ncbi:MAG: hypothetical protein HZB29_12145 [Nitrospinae bacterium]|nr:hypothetical protein [Nitrospinota bacterium]
MLLYPKETPATAGDRRKVSIIDVARGTGVILSDGEYWDGAERRGSGKRAGKKGAKTDASVCEDSPCDFFG